jgi:hypothetical protein
MNTENKRAVQSCRKNLKCGNKEHTGNRAEVMCKMN